MTWGGSYQGMDHFAMTVIHLDPVTPPSAVIPVALGSSNSTDNDFGNQGPSATGTVRLDSGSSSTNYDDIQSAYNAAADGDAILSQIGNFTGDLTFAKDIAVWLRGGFDSGFSSQTGSSKVISKITLTDGTLTVEGVVLQ
jgi:hypothetical protein